MFHTISSQQNNRTQVNHGSNWFGECGHVRALGVILASISAKNFNALCQSPDFSWAAPNTLLDQSYLLQPRAVQNRTRANFSPTMWMFQILCVVKGEYYTISNISIIHCIHIYMQYIYISSYWWKHSWRHNSVQTVHSLTPDDPYEI